MELSNHAKHNIQEETTLNLINPKNSSSDSFSLMHLVFAYVLQDAR